jgi:transposase
MVEVCGFPLLCRSGFPRASVSSCSPGPGAVPGAGVAVADRVGGRRGREEHEIAERLAFNVLMGRKWRNRFAEHRLERLLDESRPGQPRTVSDEHVEEVIVKTLESTPKDATHWSTRSRAAEVGLP